MQLLILFCPQTDLMNHFIFSEFAGVFLFIHNYMATTLQFLKFYFLRLVITFFIPGTHNSYDARWLLFYAIVLMFISTEKKSICHDVIKCPIMKHEKIPLQLLRYINLEKYITQARRKRDGWGTIQPLLPPLSKIYAKLYFSRIEKSIVVNFT